MKPLKRIVEQEPGRGHGRLGRLRNHGLLILRLLVLGLLGLLLLPVLGLLLLRLLLRRLLLRLLLRLLILGRVRRRLLLRLLLLRLLLLILGLLILGLLILGLHVFLRRILGYLLLVWQRRILRHLVLGRWIEGLGRWGLILSRRSLFLLSIGRRDEQDGQYQTGHG